MHTTMPFKSKYTKEIAERVINDVLQGMGYEDAALANGVSRNTILNWKKEHEDFKNNLDSAYARNKGEHIANIKKASQKSWQCSAWWLERTDRKSFGRNEPSIRMSGDIKVELVDYSKKPIKKAT